MDLAVVAISFAAIFVVELPDKTFVAALVLSTRYRPWAVWVGVGLAFLIQTLIAVHGRRPGHPPATPAGRGRGRADLPGRRDPAAARGTQADAEEEQTEEEYAAKASSPKSGLAAVGASFLVLFAAEWGDLSQLLTISLVGRYHDAVSVFVGAWARPARRVRPGGGRRPVPAPLPEAVDDPLRRGRRVPPARRGHGVPGRRGVDPGWEPCPKVRRHVDQPHSRRRPSAGRRLARSAVCAR